MQPRIKQMSVVEEISRHDQIDISISGTTFRVEKALVCKFSDVLETIINASSGMEAIELKEDEYTTVNGMRIAMRVIHAPLWNSYAVSSNELLPFVKFSFKYNIVKNTSLEDAIIDALATNVEILCTLSTLQVAGACRLKKLHPAIMKLAIEGKVKFDIPVTDLCKEDQVELLVGLVKTVQTLVKK